MGYLGYKPADKPLTAADITDSIITSAKIVDGTIVNADINESAGITSAKLDDLANPFAKELLHVRDEKVSGSAGGTFTSGSFQTRTLNTVMTNEITGASLASNQITLPSGTFYIEANAPAFYVQYHKLKFRNTTDSSDTLIGDNNYLADSGGGAVTHASLKGRFTISSSKTFELQHRGNITKTSDGFGTTNSFSVVEVFADVRIWKIA
jgi:hypothetical protein